MKAFAATLLLLISSSLMSEDVFTFRIKAEDIVHVVLDISTGDPWIFSMTLTKDSLAEYAKFTKIHQGDSASLVIADVELQRGVVRNIMDENPITFRYYAKEKFLAILAALPEFPVEKEE